MSQLDLPAYAWAAPTAQTVHPDSLLDGPYFPAGQLLHKVDREEDAYLPEGQFLQFAFSIAEYLPVGQEPEQVDVVRPVEEP